MYKCICNDRQILLNTVVLSLIYDYLFSYFVVFSGFKKPNFQHIKKNVNNLHLKRNYTRIYVSSKMGLS